jgi:putative transposase
MLNIIDEYTRQRLTIDVAKRIVAQDVIDVLRYLFLVRGEPDYIRSDIGPEFTAKKVNGLKL